MISLYEETKKQKLRFGSFPTPLSRFLTWNYVFYLQHVFGWVSLFMDVVEKCVYHYFVSQGAARTTSCVNGPTICPCYLQLTFASAIPSWSIPLHVRSSPWLHYSSSRHHLLCRSLHDAWRHRTQPPPLLLQNECQTGRWIYCIVMFWVLRTNILGVLEIDICHGKRNDTLETTFKLYRQHCNIFKNYKSMCSRFNNIV